MLEEESNCRASRAQVGLVALIAVEMLAMSSCVFLLAEQSVQAEAHELAESLAAEAFVKAEKIDVGDLLPPGQRLTDFPADQCRRQMTEGGGCHSEVLTYIQSQAVTDNERLNRGFHEDEEFVIRSDHLSIESAGTAREGVASDGFTERIQVCHVAGAPQEISLIRELSVELIHHPPVMRKVYRCEGHERVLRYFSRKKAKKKAARLREVLSADPSIRSFGVQVEEGALLGRHEVWAYWRHVNDATECDLHRCELTTEKEESWEEVDRWHIGDERLEALARSPHCTIVSRNCLDKTPVKVIGGREVTRPCWREQLKFVCSDLVERKPCPFFHDPRCELIAQTCVKETPYGCALWEYRFRCFYRFARAAEALGIGQTLPDAGDRLEIEEGTTSLQEVATKLAVFKDIKDQLEASGAQDSSTVELFQGRRFRCSKSVVGNLLYDCCQTCGGLSTEMRLSECTEEELALRNMRNQGLCHFVGTYSDAFLDMWKSRDVHVFCCFRSKLARVVQEQARDQVDVGWGEAKNPNCRGLLQHEFAQLDMARMDLSELYESFQGDFSQRMEDKINAFQDRVRRRVETELGRSSA